MSRMLESSNQTRESDGICLISYARLWLPVLCYVCFAKYREQSGLGLGQICTRSHYTVGRMYAKSVRYSILVKDEKQLLCTFVYRRP
jgi:hypothetical protein